MGEGCLRFEMAVDREKINNGIKKWKKENPDKIKEQKRRWRERHKEEIKETFDNWKEGSDYLETNKTNPIETAAENIIRDEASKRGQIIHGTRALNQQVPAYLKRKTEDFDVYTKEAKSAAKRIVAKLNKISRKEEFEVVPGIHKNTWKVKSKSSGKTIADYTGQGKKPRSVNVLGVRYARSEALKRKAKKILRDESASFRHDKDRDTLQRIKLTEESLDW